MEKIPEKKILNGKTVIYEYIRGSRCHGIDTEFSDTDIGGVFIEPDDSLMGLGLGYDKIMKDGGDDKTYWEFNRFMELLSESNPSVLESLFVDDEFVTVEHPVVKALKAERRKFLTKRCFDSFGHYAVEQIRKARGTNKKIVNPMTERKWPLDFCYTFYRQGSASMRKWLSRRGLDQRYCGLVGIPNMHDCYGVYYDWGSHIRDKEIAWGDFSLAYTDEAHPLHGFVAFFGEYFRAAGLSDLKYVYEGCRPTGYRGIVDEDGSSNSVRLSSVEKGVLPICYMNYNGDGYTSHCKKYKEYQAWVRDRNEKRYEGTLVKNYDAKKMCESVRLVTLCTEIARDGVMLLNRRYIDRDFLLSIKDHRYEYDELMSILVGVEKEMTEAIESSALPDDIPFEYVDSLTKELRKGYAEYEERA